MAKSEIEQKLIDYIQDAHAMEDQVVLMLNSMILSTSDKSIQNQLKKHLEETRQHAQRLQERLEAHGESASLRKETQGLPGTLVKGMVDQMRTDKPGKNARDGYVTEALEIAAYELLERLAVRAADSATAAVARRNRKEEEAMARRIEGNWDKVIDLTLAEAGIKAKKPAARATTATSRSTSKPAARSRSASSGSKPAAARKTASGSAARKTAASGSGARKTAASASSRRTATSTRSTATRSATRRPSSS